MFVKKFLHSLDIFQYAIFELRIALMNTLINHPDAFDVTALLIIQLKLIHWWNWQTWTSRLYTVE